MSGAAPSAIFRLSHYSPNRDGLLGVRPSPQNLGGEVGGRGELQRLAERLDLKTSHDARRCRRSLLQSAVELRPEESCSRPVIDTLDEPADLLVATGFSGHGLAVGPIVGRLLAELILEREEPGQVLLR